MGVGIGNFYAFHVRADLEAGRLVRVLTDYESKPKNIYAVIPHRQIVRPHTKALIEFVRDLVARPLTPVIEPPAATAQ